MSFIFSAFFLVLLLNVICPASKFSSAKIIEPTTPPDPNINIFLFLTL